jgi:hypothetical protein
MARAGLASMSASALQAAKLVMEGQGTSITGSAEAMAGAAQLVLTGAHDEAARLVDTWLAAAPPGNAGWLTPIEPLLNVSAHHTAWAPALARLRTRAA